jgi:hypothetical protein
MGGSHSNDNNKNNNSTNESGKPADDNDGKATNNAQTVPTTDPTLLVE